MTILKSTYQNNKAHFSRQSDQQPTNKREIKMLNIFFVVMYLNALSFVFGLFPRKKNEKKESPIQIVHYIV